MKKIIKGQYGPPGGLQLSGGYPNFSTTQSSFQTGQFQVPQLPTFAESFNQNYQSNLNNQYSSIGLQAPVIGQFSNQQPNIENKITGWRQDFENFKQKGIDFMSKYKGQIANIAGDVSTNIGRVMDANVKSGGTYDSSMQMLQGLEDVPGIGNVVKGLEGTIRSINGATAQHIEGVHADQEMLSSVGGDYVGSVDTINKAGESGDYSLTQAAKKRKGNKKAINLIGRMTAAYENSQDDQAKAEDPFAYVRRDIGLIGGLEPLSLSAKQGGVLKVFTYKEAPKEFETGGTIIKQFVYKEAPNSEDIDKFAKGGSFNIIPEGALHARKHNIDDTDLNITQKGIPVLSIDNNEQQAEIEHSEIIFRIEVTEKIEELLKENTDESAIKAGELLVKEILYNTDDRTDLIDQV